MADSDSEPKNILSILDQMANSTQWVKMFPVNVIFIFQILTLVKILCYKIPVSTHFKKLEIFLHNFSYFARISD